MLKISLTDMEALEPSVLWLASERKNDRPHGRKNSKLLKKRKQQNLEHKLLGISLTDMKALGLSVRDWLVRREPDGF